MNKIIAYINENEIEDMVNTILENHKNLESIDKQIREARIEFQGKSQMLQDELRRRLSEFGV